MEANAVIFPDKLKVTYTNVTVPEPGPNDVMIQTRYSWISNGTEGSFLCGERSNGETPYQPGAPWPFPIAPGYQSTGVVMHVGRNITDLRPGRWVFCALGRVEGMYEPWGGHISPKITDRSQVWPLPDGLSPVVASGLVLTQVGYNCGTRAPVNVGDTALVIGDGMVGQWAAQTLHWRGATVLLAGKHDNRLALFGSGNRRHILNVAEYLPSTSSMSSIAPEIESVLPQGINILVDTVGSIPTIMQCHPLMCPNGHIVSAGFNGPNSMIDAQKLRFGELSFHSPSGWEKRRMDETLALIASGHLETEKLITHRFPVEQAADAWRLILDRPEPVLGVILEWKA